MRDLHDQLMADYFQEEENSDKDQKRFHPQLRQSSYNYTYSYSFVNTTDTFSVPYFALMGFAEGAFFNSNDGEVNYNIS